MSRIEVVGKLSPEDREYPFNPYATSGEAWTLKDTRTGDYYIASKANVIFSGWEVLVFPGNSEGEITSYNNIAGGKGISHEEAIADLERKLEEEEHV